MTCWTHFLPFASRQGDSLGVSAYWTVAPHVVVARIYGEACRSLGELVIELLQAILHIPWHCKVHLFFGVVPSQVNSNVSFNLPIFSDGVGFLQGIQEWVEVFLVYVFDAEIVNDRSERNWSGVMLP